jgi:transporter family-2 protein
LTTSRGKVSFSTDLIPSLLVVLAGISVALQQILNASLRGQLGSPWWAGFVSYFVGMVAMLLVAVLAEGPRLSFSSLASGPGAWVAWTGGIFGSIFIATAVLMVPRLGAANVLALIVVGQMVGSTLFDHFGLFGVPQHSASLVRLAGASCLILGVVLIRA